MESKYTKRILSAFPNNFGLVENKKDPLHIIADLGGILVTQFENEESGKIKNLFVDSCDPTLPSSAYYIDMEVESMDGVAIDVLTNGGAKIVFNENNFLSKEITGFDLIDNIEPSGVMLSSQITGLSHGFDWDDPNDYITMSGSQNVYVYTDFDDTPSLIDYSYLIQSYDYTGYDEYVNIIDEDGTKVAYLSREDISDVTIIDVANLQDPNNPDSDGIIVNSSDYTVDDNKITFATERSDYNPAVLTTVGDAQMYVYPANYQPDRYFTSVYIAEYKYKVNDNPRYLTQLRKLHDVGLKDNPIATY
jgi:hypothetical protein